jgi:hypothetical protein
MAETTAALVLRAVDQAWSEENWHPPLAAAVAGLAAAQAAWRPAPGALTAWQHVNHLAFWKETVARRFAGAPRRPEEDDNDATFGPPGDPADEAGWRAAVDRLEAAHRALRAHVAAMTGTEALDDARGGMALGTAAHDAYHGAEIVQLRKLQGAWPARR